VVGPVRVWDLPTRLFHWLLVALFLFSWWSAENREMDWHRLSGIGLLGLLLFRLIWGVIGGSTARFASFLHSPGKALAYLRLFAAGPHKPGHNPVGGYSVVAMLLALIVQVTTGLFATDVDGIESGPLSYLVSFDQGRTASAIHHVSFNVLLALVGLHVLAILFYLIFRRRNLVGPMITGSDKRLEDGEGALRHAGWIRFAIALFIAAASAWWIGFGQGG
jgi:cytochrome b